MTTSQPQPATPPTPPSSTVAAAADPVVPPDAGATDGGDRALLARLIAGDEAAFDAIFRAWYAPLVRAAHAMVREQAVAEDLAQDALLELWRRRATLDAEGSAQAWLFRTVRNRALNHLRHLQVRRRSAVLLDRDERPSPEPSAPDRLAGEELAVAIRDAIEALPPRCREVFELSRTQGMRYAEIAETLGVSVKAVEANMGRALRSLRERLAPWLPGGDRL